MASLPDMTALPRVSVLCSDLSHNALGRALLLADLLRGETDVEVLGPELGQGRWGPAASSDISIEGIQVSSYVELMSARGWLRDRVNGRFLIVSKPLPTSLGWALRSGALAGRWALDIDDWEPGFRPISGAGSLISAASDLLRPDRLNTALGARWCERSVARAPIRLVSNRWLERRYGGTLLPHVRDPGVLDPGRVRSGALRRELRLDDRVWVGFIGTVRVHKGVEDLVEAVVGARAEPPPGLLLAGLDRGHFYASDLQKAAESRLGKERLRVVPEFGYERLAEYVQLADIIAVTSRETPASIGQLPAKLFDAMSMAKPVVATRVNDAAEVFDGCGVVVPPGDPRALAAAISELASDEALRQRLGRAARARLIERYSYVAGRKILVDRLRVGLAPTGAGKA